MNNAQFLGLLKLPSNNMREDALRLAVELGVQTVDADEGSLLVLDESTRELVFAMTVGDNRSETVLVGQRVPMGQGLTGLAALTGEVQVGVPSYAAIQQSSHRDDSGPRYLIAAPMFAHDRLVGILTAASFRHERQFSPEDVRLFGRVAALAGIVVAEGQREKTQMDMRDNSFVAKDETDLLQQELAEVLRQLVQGDTSRMRTVLQMLKQIAALAER